ncbi:MAG: Dabb family protein [Aliishimia sp.]
MIRHCVMLSLDADHDPNRLKAVLTDLSELCDRLHGVSGFMSGPNRDFEKKSPAFAAGFTIDFSDKASLLAYADHPEHQALGAQLIALCSGGADGIIVFDIENHE